MGPAVASATRRLPSERQLERRRSSGTPGLDGPAHGAGEQPRLLDGLGCADVMELGGPVGGAHDERHPGQMRLDHGRVDTDRGGAARSDEHRRATSGKPDPDREEGRRALVQAHVQSDAALTRQSHDERGRTRTGSHHGVGQPGAHPLVDERGRRSLPLPSPGMSLQDGKPPVGRPAGLHTTRAGRGPTVVLVPRVHPDGRFVGACRPSSSKTTSRSYAGPSRSRPLSDARGRLGAGTRRPGLSARQEAGPVTSAIRSADGAACIWPCKNRTSSTRLVIVGAHPGIPDEAGRRRRRAEDDERARWRSNGAATPSCPSSSTHGSTDPSSPT